MDIGRVLISENGRNRVSFDYDVRLPTSSELTTEGPGQLGRRSFRAVGSCTALLPIPLSGFLFTTRSIRRLGIYPMCGLGTYSTLHTPCSRTDNLFSCLSSTILTMSATQSSPGKEQLPFPEPAEVHRGDAIPEKQQQENYPEHVQKYICVPNIFAAWPRKQAINPYYEECKAASDAWLQSFQVSTLKAQAAPDKCDYSGFLVVLQVAPTIR